ncbi:uncharacterized protein ASPGLDRAFT_127911 [Aspergillus glaucus CBS 516.65]|uniref:F-box domain-containing protein n=1 Tax=Aspergillus glaucus CBS 516.65 TaxID=1160497 RepID=A0A1L9VHS8_ASPGL|nr:hypothetical protein ASPGLDRAFT_127911 [Aspergillus glaucus CBS 516.65]OJJ83432.1 hypothetical protein ASPGLDRAFT_127911 [Aspergillus glaucus CBS 516.65]
MAKCRPPGSQDEMEDALGYKVASLDNTYSDTERFYSDLTIVPSNIYEKTRNELDEYLRTKQHRYSKAAPENYLPGPGISKVCDYCSTFPVTADIYYDFGFHLPLQLTKDEALAVMSIAQPQFFKLPREVRDEIYTYAIPKAELQMIDSGDVSGVNFARGIGDPSGFYFPFRSNLGILAVNRQMRKEALRLAYRKTSIRLYDMDDFLKTAISIGEVGRHNVEFLSFTWESKSDMESIGNEDLSFGCDCIRLPNLHSIRCVQLLKHFNRLKCLRLHFESDLLSTLSCADFRNDPGVRSLCTLHRFDKLEIVNESGEPAHHSNSRRITNCYLVCVCVCVCVCVLRGGSGLSTHPWNLGSRKALVPVRDIRRADRNCLSPS